MNGFYNENFQNHIKVKGEAGERNDTKCKQKNGYSELLFGMVFQPA